MPRPTHPTHSGEGFLVGNLLVFILMFALFLGSLWALSFGTLTNVWPWALALVLFGLAFWIPQTILGRSDTMMGRDSSGGGLNRI
ncbi:hypothetical protein [Arthrobacter roseus]|uniref:hypothetical protein n=1 Tax=Arthrobacter roseus TaxID=136274 RepID=UPI00196455B6|nr:hypothetical protein [Arthrobacter roseus]MBM7848054.1 hypothetical protein [Arthrobacter roseus]